MEDKTMEGIITLPYSEYAVANKLNACFKKKDGYALFIPTSRQQKGIDLLLANLKSNKTATIQIKASRSYRLSRKNQQYAYGLWFPNFIDKYAKGNADYYILYGLYPDYAKTEETNIASKEVWNEIFLCFTEEEMFNFLKQVKQVNSDKKDIYFGLKFDNDKKVCTGRGFRSETDVSSFLLKNKLEEMHKKLK
jgi:hypothetical protein